MAFTSGIGEHTGTRLRVRSFSYPSLESAKWGHRTASLTPNVASPYAAQEKINPLKEKKVWLEYEFAFCEVEEKKTSPKYECISCRECFSISWAAVVITSPIWCFFGAQRFISIICPSFSQ